MPQTEPGRAIPRLRGIACRAVAGLSVACGLCGASAAISHFTSSADTSLMQVAPSNNNGGQQWLLSGTTQNEPNTRALLRFDLSALPSTTVIRSAQVILSVTRQPSDGLENASFGLHRMLRPWGEGTKVGITNPGQGEPAEAGEATWLFAFYPTNAWFAPGGAPGLDFAPFQSASQFVYGVNESPYLFDTTPDLVADVSAWVRNPAANFGWMLLCADEGLIFTARRFGSREDPNDAPILTVDYLVPPLLERIRRQGNTVQITFKAWRDHAYDLQARPPGTSAWENIVHFDPQPVDSLVVYAEPIATPGRFYRLVAW